MNEKTKEILFGECKWQNKKMDRAVYENLLEKKEEVCWYNNKRREYIALFSKSGFTSPLRELAEKERNILLFDLDDIMKVVEG